MSTWMGWSAGVTAVTLLVVAAAEAAARGRSATFRHALWLGSLVPLIAAPVLLALLLLGDSGHTQGTTVASPSWTVAPPPAPAETPVLAVLWLLPATLLALRSVGGWILAGRVAARATRLEDPDWRQAAEDSARALALRRVPTLAVSQEIPGPAVVGGTRPMVLLPPDVLTAPPAHRTAILDHELAHVARRDILVTRAWALLRALHWYNPLVWWAARRLDLAAECACDDAALRRGLSPRDYAAMLVATLRTPTRAGAIGAGFGAAPVVERVRWLASRRAGSAMARAERWLLLAALILALMPSGLGMVLAARSRPQERVILLDAGTRFSAEPRPESGTPAWSTDTH